MNYLLEAFRQSVYAIGNSDPNPPVGAVIVDTEGEIIGRGFTQVPGGPHAEIMAINDAVEKKGYPGLAGSTLYVTLEPCSHFGRTPPCTNSIINHKIKRVVIAVPDQTDKVKGIDVLKSGNIEVVVEDQSRFKNELMWTVDAFHYAEKNRRPRVFLKWAQTADGYLAPGVGASGSVSGHIAREVIFRMRKMLHSILVTPGTVSSDRPRLTPRFGQLSLAGRLSTDFFSEILMSFEREYPQYSVKNQKRFIMLPDLSASWTRQDLTAYLQMQQELPGHVHFIANNMSIFEDLQADGYNVHFQADFNRLDETLAYINSMGTLNLMVEAGPVFSEKYFKSGYADFLVICRSRESLWKKGRGFSASEAIADNNPDFFKRHGFEEIYTRNLVSDDFFIFKKCSDGLTEA